MSGDHSEISPSNFKRVRKCPGSVLLNRGLPEEPENKHSASARGTRAHALIEHCIKRQETDADTYLGFSLDGLSPQHGDAAPVFDKADIDAVNTTLDLFYSLYEPGDLFFLETKLDLSALGEGIKGSADIVIIKVREKWAHLIDHKHGVGVVIEVVEIDERGNACGNDQVNGYGYGTVLRFMREHEIEKVTCWISQPRAPHAKGPTRAVVYHPMDLIDWAEGMRQAIARALAPNAPCIPGEWCRSTFCKGAAQMKCEAFQKAAVAAASDAFGTIIPPGAMKEWTAEEHGRRIAQAEVLKGYLASLQEFTAQRARELVPTGWQWEMGRPGNRAWDGDETQIARLVKERTGVDITADTVLSPTEAERLIGKERFKSLVQQPPQETGLLPLVSRSAGSPKLVRENTEGKKLSLADVNASGKAAAFEIIAAS